MGVSEVRDGSAVFVDTDGQPVWIREESVLSARPNTSAVDSDGKSCVTLVWLKGHRRHVALACPFAEFAAAFDPASGRILSQWSSR